MGVPTFFRWVSEKYPKITQRCVEEEPSTFADGTEMPVDATQPNPNGMEFDNLYLDMNGIIHPCTHPEDGKEPPTMELMFAAIGKHIDRLFRLIRPRKLVYMAIDGIAPRAKMNQQRSRRFRAALEADEVKSDKEKVLRSMKSRGLRTPSEVDKPGFDSNVITPGTEFMDKLAEYLRHFIIERQSTDPAWARVKVILSDAQSPGEGEHKIMQFVRRQRAEAGHNPNTHHVMYGLDADLIMLGLASHEVMFTVLRDQVLFGKQNRKGGAKQDQVLGPSAGAAAADNDDSTALPKATGALSVAKLKPIEMLHVWILREYLQFEFRPESFETPLPFTYDFERCIDDFVFLCFFVGNDFLPHLPSLSIREGGLELLINVYRKVLPTLDGFLTEDGDLHLDRVDKLMSVLGTVEDRIFQMRRAQEEREKARKKMVKDSVTNNGRGGGKDKESSSTSRRDEPESELVEMGGGKRERRQGGGANRRVDITALPPTNVDPKDLTSLGPSIRKKQRTVEETGQDEGEQGEAQPKQAPPPPSSTANKSAAAALREKLNRSKTGGGSQKEAEMAKDQGVEATKPEVKREEEEELDGPTTDKSVSIERELSDEEEEELEELEAEAEEEEVFEETTTYEERLKLLQAKRNEFQDDVKDDVRFGEAGWKDRYYESKLGKEDGSNPKVRRQIVESYVRGLCWVLQYYYKGCQSWKWYFEFHYAPFASDLTDLASISMEWAPSRPFKPFEQLMAVLPPQSAHALPEPCRWYMTDEDSEIADFYPRTIQFDPNGKPVRWLWIALLPFIDENRLLQVTKQIEDKLNTDEKRRNAMMPDLLFVPKDSVGAAEIERVLDKSPPNLLHNWESDQIAVLKQQQKENSKVYEEALDLPAPTTAGDVRGGGHDEIFLSAPQAGGLSGFFLPTAPEFAVKVGDVVKSSFRSVIDTVPRSESFVCEFRLAPMLPHLSRLCEGLVMPPRVLTEEDLNIRRPRLSGMDVSILVGGFNGGGGGGGGYNNNGNDRYAYNSSSGLDRSWGSAEPQRKSHYPQQNPFLHPPPQPLIPGLSSQQQQQHYGHHPQAASGYGYDSRGSSRYDSQQQQPQQQYYGGGGHPPPTAQQQQGGYYGNSYPPPPLHHSQQYGGRNYPPPPLQPQQQQHSYGYYPPPPAATSSYPSQSSSSTNLSQPQQRSMLAQLQQTLHQSQGSWAPTQQQHQQPYSQYPPPSNDSRYPPPSGSQGGGNRGGGGYYQGGYRGDRR